MNTRPTWTGWDIQLHLRPGAEGVTELDSMNTVEESLELANGSPTVVFEVENLKEELRRKDARIQELEAEQLAFKNQSDTQRLHRGQEHLVAILAKQQEIDTLQQKLQETETQRIHLQNKILVLESQITDQNAQLLDKRTLSLNHDAVLRRLSITEVEHRAVVEQRDEMHQELSHSKEQTIQLTQKIDMLMERQAELNICIVSLSNNYEEQILEEKRNTDIWKHKYEGILQEFCQGHEHQPHGCVGECQHQISVEPLDPETITDEELSVDVAENDNALSNQPVISGSRDESTSRPKKHFEVGLSYLPQCKNCNSIFDMMRPSDGYCRFHLSPPQPYKTWKVFKKDKTMPHEGKQQFYWPCCDKIGIREPPGCKMLRHHDVVYPFEGEE